MQSNEGRNHEWRYLSPEAEDFLDRCRERLQMDLGMDEDAVEVILNLRSQVVSLQERIHQLEGELDSRQQHRRQRLARYRQVVYEVRIEETRE